MTKEPEGYRVMFEMLLMHGFMSNTTTRKNLNANFRAVQYYVTIHIWKIFITNF